LPFLYLYFCHFQLRFLTYQKPEFCNPWFFPRGTVTAARSMSKSQAYLALLMRGTRTRIHQLIGFKKFSLSNFRTVFRWREANSQSISQYSDRENAFGYSYKISYTFDAFSKHRPFF
jgi:hypothetical protein